MIVEVTGAAEVQTRFATANDRLRANLRRTVQGLGLQLLRVVKQDYLSGGALGVRTGRLRRSVNEETTSSGDVVTSTTGTNVSYGRFWELGFSGVEDVKAYVRRTSKYQLHATASVQVRAHQRHVNQAARPFLQPALDGMRSKIESALSAAAKVM